MTKLFVILCVIILVVISGVLWFLVDSIGKIRRRIAREFCFVRETNKYGKIQIRRWDNQYGWVKYKLNHDLTWSEWLRTYDDIF